ncbi:hypothetical protein KEM60_03026 [Austwickia sp. TVS 96-490-7B]|uniref:Rv3235 family protein n=1 Tax=Austwickia sp. TVS 96-490-7B TaxID=2830843 RepID=UPI001C593D0E|nr:Rv3235 family protein [Austwickia sp. TVS 96-490-7B]MBW3086797.1 hypothetical protein [Austwickia sp. TVS 96-490-7B]
MSTATLTTPTIPTGGRPLTDDEISWEPAAAHRDAPVVVQDLLPWHEEILRPRPTSKHRDVDFARQHTSHHDLPDAGHSAARLAMAFVEIATGARPATQVMRHCSPVVLDSLLRRQAHTVGHGLARRRPVQVRRVRTCPIYDGVVEATVIVRHAYRVSAMALRLEGLDGRWVVTALEMG